MQIPFYHQQKDWSCGAAVARMALAALDIRRSEATLRKQLGTKKGKGPIPFGTSYNSFKKLSKYYPVKIIIKKNSTLSDLRKVLSEKYIIIIGYVHIEENEGHYAILKKIDKRIHLIDPFAGPKHSYPIKKFLPFWRGEIDPVQRWFAAVKLKQKNNTFK